MSNHLTLNLCGCTLSTFGSMGHGEGGHGVGGHGVGGHSVGGPRRAAPRDIPAEKEIH